MIFLIFLLVMLKANANKDIYQQSSVRTLDMRYVVRIFDMHYGVKTLDFQFNINNYASYSSG